MHYSTKRRVALGMTTGGLLMTGLTMANAHADTSATGNTTHSPGIGSGNLIQLPVNAPINVCSNELDVIGILDSVTGNSCENNSGSAGNSGESTSASGTAHGSPGVGSGNLIEVPVNAPINVCGNQLDVIGIGNSDHGNSCANHGGGSTTASGHASGSPGIGAGNVIQVPINAPVNVCGNQVDVIGILNSVFGNSCENGGGTQPQPSPSPTSTPTPTPTSTPTPTPTPTPTQPSPTPTGVCGCTPPPPPPTTPCPPSGTSTPRPTGSASSSSPATTPTPSASNSRSHGGMSGSTGGSSGGSTGVLAHTGSGALAVAPVGAGLIGGGLLLRKRFSKRMH